MSGPRDFAPAGGFGLRSRAEIGIVLLSTAAAALTLWQPLLAFVLALAATGIALVWRWPEVSVYAFLVLMGNVKLNYYMGFFTLFPEYLVLMAVAFVWLLHLPGGSSRLSDPPLVRRLALWMFAGLLSVVFAPIPMRVLARVVLTGLAGFTMLVTIDAVRSRRVLTRALLVWEVSAALMALYGIAQIVGMVAGVDLTPRFLQKYSTPDMFIGVGTLVGERLKSVFRPNGLFNDPNIFGGYLAMAMSVTLALRIHHAAAGRRWRTIFEDTALGLMGVCMLLVLSRSGLLALAAGGVVVLSQWSGALRRPRFWLAVAVVPVALFFGAVALGSNPFVIVERFLESFRMDNGSNRVHQQAFLFGWKLFARFPFTGAGLGNFGQFYGVEVDVDDRNMMSHCAPLSAFAETGIVGGVAFLSLTWWIASRAWRVMRDRGLRMRDPEMHAIATGVFAALVAVNTANLFYDYYMRTMVWVLSGIAVSLPRLAASEGAAERV